MATDVTLSHTIDDDITFERVRHMPRRTQFVSTHRKLTWQYERDMRQHERDKRLTHSEMSRASSAMVDKLCRLQDAKKEVQRKKSSDSPPASGDTCSHNHNNNITSNNSTDNNNYNKTTESHNNTERRLSDSCLPDLPRLDLKGSCKVKAGMKHSHTSPSFPPPGRSDSIPEDFEVAKPFLPQPSSSSSPSSQLSLPTPASSFSSFSSSSRHKPKDGSSTGRGITTKSLLPQPSSAPSSPLSLPTPTSPASFPSSSSRHTPKDGSVTGRAPAVVVVAAKAPKWRGKTGRRATIADGAMPEHLALRLSQFMDSTSEFLLSAQRQSTGSGGGKKDAKKRREGGGRGPMSPASPTGSDEDNVFRFDLVPDQTTTTTTTTTTAEGHTQSPEDS